MMPQHRAVFMTMTCRSTATRPAPTPARRCLCTSRLPLLLHGTRSALHCAAQTHSMHAGGNPGSSRLPHQPSEDREAASSLEGGLSGLGGPALLLLLPPAGASRAPWAAFRKLDLTTP